MVLQKCSLASRMIPSGLNSIIAIERLIAANLAVIWPKAWVQRSISARSDLRCKSNILQHSMLGIC
ncbi:hypothetical protein D9M71_754720 [compost metagenome]